MDKFLDLFTKRPVEKSDDGCVHSDVRPPILQSSQDFDAFARPGDTLTFTTTLTVENNGHFVSKTYYHEISIKQIIDVNNRDVPGGGVYMRLVSQGVKK